MDQTTRPKYDSNCRHFNRLLESHTTTTNPENLVEAYLEVQSSYERLRSEDPVFEADENCLPVTSLSAFRQKLRVKLQKVATARPYAFNHWKFSTKHEQFFLDIAVGSPGEHPFLKQQEKESPRFMD